MRLSAVHSSQPVRVVEAPVRVSVWAVLGTWLVRRLCRMLVWLFRTPAALILLMLVVAGVYGWRQIHPAVVLGPVSLVMAVLGLWMAQWPASFDRCVWFRVRACWRAALIYRWRWSAAMDTAGLTVTRNGTAFVPPLLKVRSTAAVDRVLIRMLAGQTVDDYAAAVDRLAQTFGAVAGRVHSVPGKPHLVELWLLVRDPLVQSVGPFDTYSDVLTGGIPVARGEDGITWRLRLVGSHVLVVGATGAGKGSVIWSLLIGLADQIRAGVVQVWAIDPKGGMELAAGRALFARFCHGDSDLTGGYETGFAALLEDAVAVMRARQDRLRGVTRLHQPSVGEPLIVVLVDELAALTGWILDRSIKKRIEIALGLLLSQGRAVGVVVVGAVQDPRKDVLPTRDLFPTRIGLRVNEAEQVNLNRGATCDLIPDTLPGVAYVAVDGIAEPVRVRFSHITDHHISQLTSPADPPGLHLVDNTGQGVAA
jgi:S-DNA-T family DNA segregation ATPase FtsK/SpoIIIE